MTLKLSGTSKLLSKSGKKTRAAADSDTGILQKSPQWRWNHANMDARRAHGVVRTAIRNGTLKREPCRVCGSLRTDFHHPFHDYSRPLVGLFLCRKHHKEAEAAERDQQGPK